jgi:glycosyltransferase involved in cell wall biosynthesis
MSQHLKFCHLSTFYPPYSFGGDAAYIYRLANSLAAHGHEVDVIHCRDSYNVLAAKPASQQWPHHPGVTVHTLHSRFGPLSPLLSQQTGRPWLKAKRLRQILHSKKFDVIHYHNISLFGPKVLEMKLEYKDCIRLYTTHEHWLICPMHVLWKNNDRLCDRPQCFRCTLKHRRPPQWWRYTNLLHRSSFNVDLFISPSRFTIDMHRQRGFDKPFVQLPYFSSAPDRGQMTEQSNTRPYFLFVGRLEKIKGLQDVIPIFRRYTHADLLVAGEGSYDYELRRLARGLDNIDFLGWLPPSRLSALYRNAVALIVPSICYEVLGMVLFEAFASRTPAIVNALGALPEIVQECQGGLVYRNQEELLDAMERLQENGKLRRQLGANAYRKWEQQWSEHAHLRLYFDILNETAQRKYGRVPWGAAGNSPTAGREDPASPHEMI